MARPSPKTHPETDPAHPPTPGETMTLEERKKRQLELGTSAHVDVDELHHASGLFAVISQRRANGAYTAGFFKKFERNGIMERTSFIPESLMEDFQQLVGLVRERIQKIRASGTAPFKERQK